MPVTHQPPAAHSGCRGAGVFGGQSHGFIKTETLHKDTYQARNTSYKCTPYVEPEVPEEPDPTDPDYPDYPDNPDEPTDPTEPDDPMNPWD